MLLEERDAFERFRNRGGRRSCAFLLLLDQDVRARRILADEDLQIDLARAGAVRLLLKHRRFELFHFAEADVHCGDDERERDNRHRKAKGKLSRNFNPHGPPIGRSLGRP